MDHSQTLIKTAKGLEEIRSKALNLEPSLRHLLILVDEHSPVSDLLAAHPELGDEVDAQLETLLAEGFLAPHPSAFEMGAYSMDDWDLLDVDFPAPRDAAPAGVAIVDHPKFNLDKAKGFARYIVLGSLGPVGAHRVERIDAAETVGELRAELDSLRDILPELLSKHQANEVWEQLEPLMTSIG
jgi:hypothetical protein